MISNILAEVCYTGIVAVAGVRECSNSKSKLSLIFALYLCSELTIGAYRQNFHSNRCSFFGTTSGFVAVICSVITIVIRMSVIVDPRFYKRHIGTFKTYGLLSLLRYNVATKGCKNSIFEVFLAILWRFIEKFRLIIITLIAQVNYIDAFLHALVLFIMIYFLIVQGGIEFFDHRLIL